MSRNLDNYTRQLKAKNNQIKYIAYHDALTNLPNRRMLKEDVKFATQEAEQNDQMVAVLFLDLDRFKFINDIFGHITGDYLLKNAAKRMKDCLREGDYVYRIGGDEFTIVLMDANREIAAQEAEKIMKVLEPAFHVREQELCITPSIGISLYPNDGEDFATLLKSADSAMYRAKELGKNNYHFYTSEINETLQREMRIEKEMRKALKENQFEVYYQPKLNLKNDRFIGMEALIRWEHPELGMISPGEFIPLAEDTGLIIPIGEWVLRQACAQNKQWQEKGYEGSSVAVNLSPYQFQQPGLVDVIANVLDETKLDAQYLELEITESIAMHNETYVISKLQSLKKLGIKLSIDDFGTGYSSLSYLKKYPVDALKIDRSFVKDISANTEDEKIIATIIAMAHHLNLNVIAEGIETEEQLYFLKSQACDQGQGFLFGKPMPARDLDLFMKFS